MTEFATDQQIEADRMYYSARVGIFIANNPRFEALPEELKEVATNAAVKALQTSDKYLLAVAEEIDSRAVHEDFALFDKELNRKIISAHLEMRHKMFRQGYSSETVEPIANRQLRISIASRLSRLELAKALGYKKGKAQEIVSNENFKAANDLAWQAVESIQASLLQS